MNLDPRAARETLGVLFAAEYMDRFPSEEYYRAHDWASDQLLNMQDDEVCSWVQDILSGMLTVSSRYNDTCELTVGLDAA